MDNSKEKHFLILLDKCRRQEETDSERKEFLTLLLDDEIQELVDRETLQLFAHEKETISLSQNQKEKILQRVFTHNVPKSRIRHITKWNWVAAAILIITFSVPLMLQLDKNQQVKNYLSNAMNSFISKDETTMAGEVSTVEPHTTIIQLADGKKLNMDEVSIGQELHLGALKLIRVDSNSLRLLDMYTNRKPVISEQSIITPIGQTCSIILPDESSVILNSASKITFSSSMRTKRIVDLDGEAYFDVKTDSSRRFIVRSSANKNQTIKGQEVTVFGTQFNVNSYSNSSRYECTLIEGSVQVSNTNSTMFLTPGTQSDIGSQYFVKKDADLSSVLAWKSNLFYFNGLPIEEAMLQISNWYGIVVHYENQPKDIKIWGQLSRQKTLGELLKILEKTNDIRFKIKGKEVYVNT